MNILITTHKDKVVFDVSYKSMLGLFKTVFALPNPIDMNVTNLRRKIGAAENELSKRLKRRLGVLQRYKADGMILKRKDIDTMLFGNEDWQLELVKSGSVQTDDFKRDFRLKKRSGDGLPMYCNVNASLAAIECLRLVTDTSTLRVWYGEHVPGIDHKSGRKITE